MFKDGFMCFKVECLGFGYIEWDPRNGKHILRTLTKKGVFMKIVLIDTSLYFGMKDG